nr:hypothetical protein CFP56_21804 [Quercus suber]
MPVVCFYLGASPGGPESEYCCRSQWQLGVGELRRWSIPGPHLLSLLAAWLTAHTAHGDDDSTSRQKSTLATDVDNIEYTKTYYILSFHQIPLVDHVTLPGDLSFDALHETCRRLSPWRLASTSRATAGNMRHSSSFATAQMRDTSLTVLTPCFPSHFDLVGAKRTRFVDELSILLSITAVRSPYCPKGQVIILQTDAD